MSSSKGEPLRIRTENHGEFMPVSEHERWKVASRDRESMLFLELTAAIADLDSLREIGQRLVTAWDEKDNNDLFTAMRFLRAALAPTEDRS